MILACLELVLAGAVSAHLGGFAGTRLAAAADGGSDPLSYLGSTFDASDCGRANLAVGKGFFVRCDTFTANTSVSGVVRVVSLYSADNPVVEEYAGTLPRSLHWGQSISGVLKSLGEPSRISDMYGPPTLVYMYSGERYGSLELQFDTRNRLVRLNASLEK